MGQIARSYEHERDRGCFLEFREQVMVHAQYYRFDKMFTSDPNVDVGSNDREPLLRQGLSEAMYEKQSRAYLVWFSVTGV